MYQFVLVQTSLNSSKPVDAPLNLTIFPRIFPRMRSPETIALHGYPVTQQACRLPTIQISFIAQQSDAPPFPLDLITNKKRKQERNTHQREKHKPSSNTQHSHSLVEEYSITFHWNVNNQRREEKTSENTTFRHLASSNFTTLNCWRNSGQNWG